MRTFLRRLAFQKLALNKATCKGAAALLFYQEASKSVNSFIDAVNENEAEANDRRFLQILQIRKYGGRKRPTSTPVS